MKKRFWAIKKCSVLGKIDQYISPAWWFVIKFLGLFGLFYGAAFAIIGLSAPGKLYSPFIDHYFDLINWIKDSIVWGTKHFVSALGYDAKAHPDYRVRIGNRGVVIARDCVGIGVKSFWAAFVIASFQSWKKLLFWLPVGLLALWAINILRISLLLIAVSKGQTTILGLEHHTFFNVLAYGFIFLMIWLYSRKKHIEVRG